MKVYWKNDSLRKKVETYARSNKRAQRRMISIEAARSFDDLALASMGKAHFLKGKKYRDCFAINLERQGNGKRLICKPYDEYKKDVDGHFIKDTIKEIEIIDIDDYHR